MKYLSVFNRYRGQKRGKEYWIPCPFHHDKDPSLSVNLSAGMWHCFGCGRGGPAPKLLMQLEGVGYEEARSIIRERGVVGMKRSVSRETKVADKPKQRVTFLKKSLFDRFFPVEDKVYLEYLKERKIKVALAHEYDLRQGTTMSGSWNKRLIYAIRDMNGRIASIEGRTVNGSDVRYYKQPGSLASIGLFGIERYRDEKLPFLYVCEGVFDALSIASTGRPAVAMCSSSLSKEQIRQLRKVTRYPIVLLDGAKDTDRARADRKKVADKLRLDMGGEFGSDGCLVHEITIPNVDPNELLVSGKLRRYMSAAFKRVEAWREEEACKKTRSRKPRKR